MTEPPPRGLPPDELTSFVNARDIAQAVEAMLRRHDIEIQSSSDLEQQLLAVIHWEERRVGSVPFDPYADYRAELRAGVGALHMFELLLDADSTSNLTALKPHLELLNQGDISQNSPAPYRDGTNKLFELFLGAVCMRFATNVELDDPIAPRGTNPDVLFQHREAKWGLACKVPAGRSVLTLYERVQKGVDQIQQSPASSGYVVLNMRNYIDHDALVPLLRPGDRSAGIEPTWGVYRRVDDATDQLIKLGCDRLDEFIEMNESGPITRIFDGQKAQPGILLFLQSMCYVGTDRGPVPTRLGHFHLWTFGECDEAALETLQSLNLALHKRS